MNKRMSGKATATETADGFGVTWNGREIRTPARTLLRVPTRALAEAIAAEWSAQRKKIRPQTMPCMQFASTAIDRIREHRAAVTAEVAGFAATDLLCYRADDLQALADRQNTAWQPLLDWAREQYDVALRTTRGIVPVDQPAGALERIESVVASMDEFTLAGVQTLTGGFGSLVRALAVLEGRLSAEAAFELSQIDEDYQAELWGADEIGRQRRDRMANDMRSAETYLRTLSQ